MDNGPDREVSKVEDLAKATPGMAWKLAKGFAHRRICFLQLAK